MRSSSSSAPDAGPDLAGFGDFVARGLATLRAELPWCWAATAAALDGRSVLLVVGAEPVRVRARRGEVAVLASAEGFAPCVTLVTDPVTVLRLADAETTVVDATLDGSIALRGDVDDLVAFHDGLVAFLHGAVRSPSFPRLLDLYRRWATTPARGAPR